MSLDEGVSDLIGRIYRSSVDHALWPSVLDELIDRTCSRFVVITVTDTRKQQFNSVLFHGPDTGKFMDGINDYTLEHHKRDPLLTYGLCNPNAGLVTIDGAIRAQGGDVRSDPYVKWMENALGVGNSVLRYTPSSAGLTLGVSLHPSAERQVHDAQDLALFAMLFGHIENATRLAARPPDFMSARHAWVLLDGQGMVQTMSDAAHALIAQNDGLSVIDRRLVGASRRDNDRISAAILKAIHALEWGSRGGCVLVHRPSGRRSLIVDIVPLPSSSTPLAMLRPAVAVSIIDPEAQTNADPARWCDAFGLTKAEARVASGLRLGKSDDAIAAALGLKVSTVRSHVKSILGKTETRSKAELAHLLTLASP